ncbi:hypothetical protein [Cupriavidus lacunae]|uniref:hypothetical protein n=1 Tax=Cupriavidus lacunae TaxID=2666307 RepID=UPI001FCA2A8A|nr:hypothetical protein [Cupriavidus lacunae]
MNLKLNLTFPLRAFGAPAVPSPWDSTAAGMRGIVRHWNGWSSTRKASPQHRRSPRSRHTFCPCTACFRDNAAVLLDAYRASAAEMESGGEVAPAAEWLLDNYHIIEEQIREIRDDLSPRLLSPAAQARRVAIYGLSARLRAGLGLCTSIQTSCAASSPPISASSR